LTTGRSSKAQSGFVRTDGGQSHPALTLRDCGHEFINSFGLHVSMLQSTTRYAARQMMSARKQNGKAAPWNYYSGVPLFPRSSQEAAMNGIIYLIGLIVVILAILSFFGLR
jgi:hypothetical protein